MKLDCVIQNIDSQVNDKMNLRISIISCDISNKVSVSHHGMSYWGHGISTQASTAFIRLLSLTFCTDTGRRMKGIYAGVSDLWLVIVRTSYLTGLIPGLHLANERRYKITLSLIGWAHTCT